MPNIDLLKEIQADPSLIVATYPELPQILSSIGLVAAVVALVFFIISVVAANRAYHHIPGSESKTNFMVTMAGIWSAIALIILVTMAFYPRHVDFGLTPEAASRDHIAANKTLATFLIDDVTSRDDLSRVEPHDSLINHAYQSLTDDVEQAPTFTARKNGTLSVFAVLYDPDTNTVTIHDTEGRNQP